MDRGFYHYIQQLQSIIQSQEHRILRMERTIKTIQNELAELKNRPSVQVDKIEYKFDQLKVETLEGTLNIGLNPGELQGIEDFAVNNQEMAVPYSPKEQMQTVMAIEDSMYRYLDAELPRLINEKKKELGLALDESYTEFIKEDLKKQLPGRIELYLKQIAPQTRSGEPTDHLHQQIINRLTEDIQQAVHAFLSNFPPQ